MLERANSQLGTVQKSIEAAGVRTRAIERQLRKVEELPADDARRLLGEEAVDDDGDTD